MEEIEKHQILMRLSQWVQIVRVGDKGGDLIVEGYIKPGNSLREIEQEMRDQVSSIRQTVSSNGRQIFYVRLAGKRIVIPRINLILFVITIFTTILAGAMLEGVNPVKNPLSLIKGVPFSIVLMLILGFHEFGHFSFAKKHKIDATLPYFIPAPTFIGTFGAFIKIRSPIRKRIALLEIGAAGPIAGFMVAVPALFIGLSLSEVVEKTTTVGIQLGNSILMIIATKIIFPGLPDSMDILLHSTAFAAWIGMLVTMINLLPIGQLDGGHIAYAILGKRFKKVAWSAFGVIIALGVFSINWLVWALLVFFLIKIKHPPILDEHEPVTKRELMIGLIALGIFLLTFIPVPFQGF